MAEQQPEIVRRLELARAEPAFDVVRRGFDRDQVLERVRRDRERVVELEARIARVVRERDDARREVERVHAAPRDRFAGVSEHVIELVREFDQEVEQHRRDAELERTTLVADARAEAARMRLDAEGEAEQTRAQADLVLREVQQQASSVRQGLDALRASTLGRVRETRDRLRDTLGELDRVLAADPDGSEVVVLGEADPLVPEPPEPFRA